LRRSEFQINRHQEARRDEMEVKPKKQGFGLEMRTFKANTGESYLVFRTKSNGYHVFLEVEAKQASSECGAIKEGNTRQMWGELWSK
jgi:hypothetical protein